MSAASASSAASAASDSAVDAPAAAASGRPRWLWDDAPDRRHRFARRGLAGLMAARMVFGSFGNLANQPDAQFRPPGFLDWMSGFPSAPFLVAVQVVGVALAVLAASGWGTTARPDRPASPTVARLRDVARRGAYPAAWLVYLYLEGVKTSGGKILHNDVLLLLVALPLVFASENRGERTDDGGWRPVGPRHNVGWTINTALLMLVLAYFLAGVAKLRHSGLEWVFSDNIRYVMYWAQHGEGVPSGIRWIAAIPADNPVIARIVGLTTIVFEVGAPAILVWKRLRPWFALMAVALHLGTWAMIGLDYWGWALTALILLIDWGQGEPRRRVASTRSVAGTDDERRAVVAATAPGRDGFLLYDGDCGFCSRTVRWLRARGDGLVAAPSHSVDLDEVGLTDEQVTTEVWWIAADGTAQGGHRAIGMALWSLGGAWVAAGRFLVLEPVGIVAGPIYAAIARNRHRMPGATDACRIDGS